jgi:hypothetical protein
VKTFLLIYALIGLLMILVLTTIALHTSFGQRKTKSVDVEACKKMHPLEFVFWGAVSVPLWPITIYLGVLAGVRAYRAEMEKIHGRGE